MIIQRKKGVCSRGRPSKCYNLLFEVFEINYLIKSTCVNLNPLPCTSTPPFFN